MPFLWLSFLLLLVCRLHSAPASPAPSGAETTVVMLSGSSREDAVNWDFMLSQGRGSGIWTKIAVPSCWEQEGFGCYDYGGSHRKPGNRMADLPVERGTYRRTFDVPESWRGRVVRIVFDGVATDATVFLNGSPVGEKHQGGFYTFSFDLTPLLKYGATNALEVQVDRNSSNEGVNRAERIGDYWNFSGIYRPVWLEVLPPTHIDWTAIDARADGSLTAQVNLAGAAPRDLQVSIQCLDTNGRPVAAPVARGVPAGATSVELRASLAGVRPWTAETPHLYTLSINLEQGGRLVHSRSERIGFRTFEVRKGEGLFLNGSRIVLKGVNRHCFDADTARTISRAQSYADARLIKEMNMNAVRMSHYPPDRHFLEACDELGLYVLDELAGWQGSYDTPTATRLIGQIVRRDVNHPAILFWDNGNEGGWNTAVDDEFARWDIQKRQVLHPWELFRGMNTAHYRTYAQHLALCQGPDIYMPTEFLHGLYDGGIGAGLRDYWDAMMASPRRGGGFFWAFADEGIRRTDQGGRIDNAGNAAPDGIVGPKREKEASFHAVRELWSPVRILAPARLAPDFNGTLGVENHYDFTPLTDCTFSWKLMRLAPSARKDTAAALLAEGKAESPAVAPHGKGSLSLALPGNWREADALYLTARGPGGAELWTWSWPCHEDRPAAVRATPVAPATPPVRIDSQVGRWVLETARLRLVIDKQSGELSELSRGNQILSLRNGPRLVASRRNDRSFPQITPPDTLTRLTVRQDGADALVEASYAGCLQSVTWRVTPADRVYLDYEYRFEGEADLLGIRFEYPEGNLVAKRWLGQGPHPVWKNRLEGGRLDVWSQAYNNPIPGQTYSTSPNFKGLFRDWSWLRLETTQGDFTVTNVSGIPYLGLFRVQDGTDGLYDMPDLGLAALDAIPPMRNKFHSPDLLGPDSIPACFTGTRKASLIFDF
jgi:hypothetical protein